MNNNQKKLTIVVPCFNEEAVLNDSAAALSKVLKRMIDQKKVAADSRICFVDDGSYDNTWSMITKLSSQSALIEGIRLTRNFGHQGALLAGLFSVFSDAYVTIDADLQDDESVIPEMVDKYRAGNDIVYGVRGSRKSDTFFKRTTATMYYRFLRILGVKSIYNHADFRLMSERAVSLLRRFPEKNLFLRATVPLIGLDSTIIHFDRKKREKGESKYPLGKMISFAWDGITSFSVVPLRVVTALGFSIVILSVPLVGYSIYRWLSNGTVAGWTSLITIICLFSGVQLLSLGIIGEYIGKIYKETKNRPSYLIGERTDSGDLS